MNQAVAVTDRQKQALAAIQDGHGTVSALATQLEVSYSAANAMVKRLEENGLVEQGEEGYVVTSDGTNVDVTGRGLPEGEHRPGTKIAQAKEIMAKYAEKGRQFVLEQFRTKLDMSDSGAATYYQTLRGEHAVAAQNARGRKPAGKQAGRRGGNAGNKAGNGNNAKAASGRKNERAR